MLSHSFLNLNEAYALLLEAPATPSLLSDLRFASPAGTFANPNILEVERVAWADSASEEVPGPETQGTDVENGWSFVFYIPTAYRKLIWRRVVNLHCVENIENTLAPA